MDSSDNHISVQTVTTNNWRYVTRLTVTNEQQNFVADASYYLALCCYDTWNPLAICAGDTVVGFMMWGVDEDKSCWLGGILVDQQYQQKGYGKRAVEAAIQMLQMQTGATIFALSYQKENTVASNLYKTLGFTETGETEGEEIVARLKLNI